MTSIRIDLPWNNVWSKPAPQSAWNWLKRYSLRLLITVHEHHEWSCVRCPVLLLVSWSTCLNSAFNGSAAPHSSPVTACFLKPEEWVTPLSVKKKKIIRPAQGGARLGDGKPAAMMNTGGGRSWTPTSMNPTSWRRPTMFPGTHADLRERGKTRKCLLICYFSDTKS